MVDYNLSGLSARSFEHLVQALATAVFGPEVIIFGDGPDGAREATFEGSLKYGAKEWSGYLVFQAKFLQKPNGRKADGEWLMQQINNELGKFMDKKRVLRKPDFYIVATNVELTSVAARGTKDKLFKLLDSLRPQVGYQRFDVWDYDKVRVLLDQHRGIATAYQAWITPGDVLAQLLKAIENPTPNFDEVLATFLKKELLSDQYANLEQAGHNAENQVPLAGVFVDLPATDKQLYEPDDKARGFTAEIVDSAREIYRSEGNDLQKPNKRSGRFVLIGGPGQGKTTIGQYICQLFRAAFLEDRNKIPPEVQNVLRMVKDQCRVDRLELPRTRRFPVRVVLSEFAKAIAAGDGRQSLLEFVSERIAQRTNQRVTAALLKQWLGICPWLLILDGLDEVPSSSNRNDVLRAIEAFWVDVSESNGDLLVIATTRPQGYSFEFSPSFYEHRYLVPLSPIAALKYAKRLVEIRYNSDADRSNKILGRLQRASREPATARLMRSPLQITIMATLVDRIGQLPQERWSLFREYYNVIYNREVERSIPAAQVLREHRGNIDAIHREVGLTLQVESERTGKTDSKLTIEQFSEIVNARLAAEGHTDPRLHSLGKTIIDASTHRLVFLVGLESDQIGFEVRSLQEFMAAEGLMAGSDDSVRNRLRHIAPLSNWRAVFLFAAGKCYTDRQHLRDIIHAICGEMNDDPEDAALRLTLSGSLLALDLLEDGAARLQPRHSQSLARLALRLLVTSNAETNAKLAGVYQPELSTVYQDELRQKIRTGNHASAAAAWAVAVGLRSLGHSWVDSLIFEPLGVERTIEIDLLLNAVQNMTVPADISLRLTALLGSASPLAAARYLRLRGSRRIQGASWAKSIAQLPSFNVGRGSLSFTLQTGERLFVLGFDTIATNYLRGLQSIPSAGNAWKPDIAVSRFLARPSKERLADCLRAIAIHGSPEAPWGLPWPLRACLGSNRSKAELRELAEHSEEGLLGEASDWHKAEYRWLKGVAISELYDSNARAVPFDRGIKDLGIPIDALTAITWSHQSPMPSALDEVMAFISSRVGSKEAGTVANWLSFLASRPTASASDLFSDDQITLLVEAGIHGAWSTNVSLLGWHAGTHLKDSGRLIELADKIGGARSLHASGPTSAEVVRILSEALVLGPHRQPLIRVLNAFQRTGAPFAPLPAQILDPRGYQGDARIAAINLLVCQAEWGRSPKELAQVITSVTAKDEREISNILRQLGSSLAQDTMIVELASAILELCNTPLVLRSGQDAMMELLKKRRSGLSDIGVCQKLNLPAIVAATCAP